MLVMLSINLVNLKEVLDNPRAELHLFLLKQGDYDYV